MSYKSFSATFFVLIGLTLSPLSVLSESDNSSKYRVLSTENSSLNISSINTFLDQAEVSIKTGNLDEAFEKLTKARTASNLLINYYKDLSGSFRGIDALIPREIAKKNQDVIELLAKVNIQLATIHRSKGEPELAVPLLVGVVKMLTPLAPNGNKAYKQLVELGFVDTPYRGGTQ